ncbi:MAG: EFR1 family ferrodoxin [Deltaproteobacteria bacterium]|nr:EFR1 family ferrodoxin [Deltaproteobacteria bacterium]
MQTHTLFFSPTKTGATVAQAVQNGLQGLPGESPIGESIDITKAAVHKTFDEDDTVIVVMPVYSGRLPKIAVERFKAVNGNGAKGVAIAIYGNANAGDALLELTDICKEQGFEVIAAANFIGEHSFTMKQFPLAAGRPDTADLQKAEKFAELIREVLNGTGPLTLPKVPGSHPYSKDPMNLPGVAATGTNLDDCTICGLCETVCPTSAITMTENGPQTDGKKCSWCSACVKVCKSNARLFTSPKVKETAERLFTNFQERQEPKWFLPARK